VRLRIVPVLLLATLPAFGQSDPGPRGGSPAAGGPLNSVAADPTVLSFFNDAQTRFSQIDSVAGQIQGESGVGLGPRYNSRSCARCHAQPTVGGSSPTTNPQIADASADGALNTIPTFITTNGPVREARFIYFTDANGNPITSKPNGNVEPLFTIAGRSDSVGCSQLVISQPDFATQQSHNNIIYRIPTPVFGAGLIENVDDSALLSGLALKVNNQFGISGTFNRSANDGTIMRFGWKAQNKSLEIFAGEAYNVEMGVSNELFPQERPTAEEDADTAHGLDSRCRINATPEDHTNFNKPTQVATLSDTVQFAMFMRLLKPPAQNPAIPGGNSSIFNGEALFNEVGCGKCHQTSFTTSASSMTGDLNNVSFRIFSDLEIHHMGTALADNIVQGNATADMFRTAPLWGLGQRIFLLHDGRYQDLLQVIAAHSSTNSEASTAVSWFNGLNASDRQDVLNFLRSL
jgi:CxxC motif-containing protein (DUF1111 family)